MARIAFRLRIRPNCIAAYEEAHRRVWPEMLQALRDVSITRYSIFRRGVELFLYMHVEDFQRAWEQLDRNSVNQRWQAEMAPFFEPPADLQPGERFPMMHEVFYLD